MPEDLKTNSTVSSLIISEGDMYAGGYRKNSSGVCIAGYWKNGSWVGLTSIDETRDSFVTSIVVAQGHVYAAGYCVNSSGVFIAGYWFDGTWIGLGVENSIAYSIFVCADEVPIGAGNAAGLYPRLSMWIRFSRQSGRLI